LERWGAYATALAPRLEADGFQVFLDRADYALGDDWKKAGAWTLRHTGQLILVGSPAAIRSDPVIHEVKIFSKTRRRIVPIDFAGSLEWTESDSPLAPYLPAQILRIREPAAALHSGPSEETVAAIRRTFDLVRHDRKRVSAFAIIALLLGVLAVAATVFGISAFLERKIALKNEGISLAALCFA
jgi:TIR domain